MSINVTVTGNPVSIKRGKMITADPETAKKDFDKRRLLRLEQVRQQSKELAEDVRNKVRREKKKQMGEIEREGREKLKSWQNRKLLELQNQYLDAMDEIGAGHKEAEQLADESDILENQRIQNEEMAKNRGRLAETKLQVQKNEENYKKAMPVQHKKLVRDIENTRAALVSSMPKKSPKKCGKQSRARCRKSKPSTDINITIPNDSDFSEVSSSDSSKRLPSIQEEVNQESEGFCECSDSLEGNSNSLDSDDDAPAYNRRSCCRPKENVSDQGKGGKRVSRPSKQALPRASNSPSRLSPHSEPKKKSYKDSIDKRRKLIEDFRSRPRGVPLDTRISDRIKRRQLMVSQPDYCDLITDPTPVPEVEESSRIRDKISSRSDVYFDKTDDRPLKDPLELTSEECMCTKAQSSCPCKPKDAGASKSTAAQTDSVEDHRKSCKCGTKRETKPSKSSGREQLAKSQPADRVQPIRSGPSDTQIVTGKVSGPPKDIPTKPAVKLKDVEQPAGKSLSEGVPAGARRMAVTSSQANKIRHYDFPNRFVREVTSTSQVEKIEGDNVEVIPDIESESERYEKMKQRDFDAQVRGKRALEKEKIQRDYEEMMRKLPMLQRKEHIAQIGTDKPEYHMSEERLKERERERQNRLENAYSKALPDLKPKIVTLPSRRHDAPKGDEPFEILDGDDARTLNLGKWDTDTKPKKMFSAEEVQEIIKAFTVQRPEDRKAKLKQLLKSLKLQKEQLINEIRALPKDDSINALISDLTSFSDEDDKPHLRDSKHRNKSDRKRQLDESDSSSETSVRDRKSKTKGRSKDKHRVSPCKKMKKPLPRVLVLQNMSTQTTPKATKEKSSTTTTTTTTSSSVQVSDQLDQALSSGIRICTESHVPCDCYQGKEAASSEEVCKIYIKLNEEESPKVEVVRSARDSSERGVEDDGRRQREEEFERQRKSPRKEKDRTSKSPSKEQRTKSPAREDKSPKERPKRVETKSVATETERFKKPVPKTVPGRSKNESWKEHLSRNSMSTSSTSYMSPPDFSRPNTTASTETSKQSMYNLRKKPQQTNIDRSSTLRSSFQSTPGQDAEADRKLLEYIKRLLSMSKTSVDDLGVSSSDVQTPSQSVIEMESNNPLAALHNVIRYINFRAADVAKELTVSADDVAQLVPPNTTTDGSSGGSVSKLLQEPSPQIPEKDSSSSSKTKETLLCQYADVTDSCSKRIANLAAMIEQLRQEKIQLLESPPPLVQKPLEQGTQCDPLSSPRLVDLAVLTPTLSDRDNSTRYFEFPPSGEKSKGTNSTASMDEEELNRRLLEIDMSLADKLRRFRHSKNGSSGAENGNNPVRDNMQPDRTPLPAEDQLDEADQQFLERLQRLVQESHERDRLAEQPQPEANTQVPFVSFLVDIPKLPILEPEPEDSERRHPPPSKGLSSAKKFNGNISLVPHELSTIIEADSQLSTRVSPNNSRTGTSLGREPVQPPSPTVQEHSLPTDKSDKATSPPEIPPPIVSPARSNKTSFKQDSVTEAICCTDDTCPSIALSSSSSSQQLSSSSSGDLRSIEAMLKSIGMEWAIPTLHKTQEALALSSSSSSGDLSSKKRNSRRSTSTSEVSLKDFLKKQMMSKISSSSLNRSDASPASFVRECSEISAIQASSSAEKAKQRTSTPVLSSKSTSKSKEEQQQQLFTGASDISSVRYSSCEGPCNKSSGKQSFHSLVGDEDSSQTKSSVE